MPHQPQDLNALIGSRICHDLISPLGAIGNGVELLTMTGAGNSPEMQLISESIENANARIRFFRIAFGAAAAGQSVSVAEIRSILRDMPRGDKVNYDWQPSADMPRREVKLAFLLLQCFDTALPWGGRVTVAVVGNDWAITGEAEKLNATPAQWDLLDTDGTAGDVDAAHVQFALAPLAAADMDRAISVERSATMLRVRF